MTSQPMQGVEQRRLVDMGGTIYVSLPRKFVDYHGLIGGQKVAVQVNTNHLKILPYEREPVTTG